MRRQAFATLCSGKDRITVDQRAPLHGGNAQHSASRSIVSSKHSDHTRERLTASTTRRNMSKEEWMRLDRSLHTPFPFASANRSKLCLASICSLLNATQPEPRTVDVVAIVDEDTPLDVREGYARNGVRIIDLAGVEFPSYWNNPEYSVAAQHRGIARGATVAEALRDGLPHFSSLPNSWYKLWLWNLTEYTKIFFMDADTLTQHNATRSYLLRYEPFAALMFPSNGRPQFLNSGMMVLQPDWRGAGAWLLTDCRELSQSSSNRAYYSSLRNHDARLACRQLHVPSQYAEPLRGGQQSGRQSSWRFRRVHLALPAESGAESIRRR